MRITLSRLRWLILGLLGLSTVINYVDRQALSILLPTLRRELGLTSTSYGTIATLFLLAYTFAQLGWGLLVDRIGPKRGFSISVAIWSFAAIAHAFCFGAFGFGLCRIFLGIGEAGNWPAGGKAISEWFPRERRAFAMGFFDGGSGIGAMLAPPIVAALALTLGWRAAFIGTGCLGLIWLVGWTIVYQQASHHPWLAAADQRRAEVDAPQSPASGKPRLSRTARRSLAGLMATRLLATPVWWFYVFWLPDYLTKERHFSLIEIGLFAWIPYVTVDIGKLIGGGASDWLLTQHWPTIKARKSVMAGGALCMTAGLMVSGAATSSEAIAWISVATFGFGLWSANILALHADLFPPRQIGKALGITGTAASLGGAASAYLIGLMVDLDGYRPVFFVAGLAALAAFIVLHFGVPEISHPSRPQPVNS